MRKPSACGFLVKGEHFQGHINGEHVAAAHRTGIQLLPISSERYKWIDARLCKASPPEWFEISIGMMHSRYKAPFRISIYVREMEKRLERCVRGSCVVSFLQVLIKGPTASHPACERELPPGNPTN
jgi:hypothetical protein